MKREWDTVPRQWHWQRALSSVQGKTTGSHCRRTLICILFFVPLSPYFSVGVWFLFISLFPSNPHASEAMLLLTFSVHLPPQLLTRYVKTSTSSPCRGNEPRPERPSTTSVQRTPLVSHVTRFAVCDQRRNVCAVACVTKSGIFKFLFMIMRWWERNQ